MPSLLKIVVLDEGETLKLSEEDWPDIRKNVVLICHQESTVEEEKFREATYAAHCICTTGNPSMITEELLNSLPNLDLFICEKAYADSIDLDLFKRFNIKVEFFQAVVQLGNPKSELSNLILAWVDDQYSTDPNILKIYHQRPETILGIITDKKVESLYHANTLTTSQTFIEEGALLSRAYVEGQGLQQTPQDSDEKDKKYGVWDDVFLDGVDNHVQHRRANVYGPVLFVLKPELLAELGENHLLVTRINPHYWENFPNWKSRYIYNPQELARDYKSFRNDSSRMMFTVRSCGKQIDLKTYLKEIIIDISNINVIHDGVSQPMGIYLQHKLRTTLDENGLEGIPIRLRHPPKLGYNCTCIWEYAQLRAKKANELRKRIKSKVNP